MHRFKFKLGCTAKSKITGFKGTITGRSKNHGGCDRYVIQPEMSEDGKVADSMYYDDVELEILDDTGDLVKEEMYCDFKFNMLDQVEDKVTKLKGTITGFVQYLNGCKHVWIQPKVVKDMKIPDGGWCPIDDIKVTKAFKPAKPKASRPPGGPPSAMR